MRRNIERDDARKIRGILYRWGRVPSTLLDLHQQIRDFECLLDDVRSLGAQQYDGMPGSKEPGDPTAARAAKAIALQEEYQKTIEWLMNRAAEEVRLKTLIDEHLELLSPADQELIRLRYGNRLQWVTVSMRMGYSEEAVRKRDREVILKLSENIF